MPATAFPVELISLRSASTVDASRSGSRVDFGYGTAVRSYLPGVRMRGTAHDAHRCMRVLPRVRCLPCKPATKPRRLLRVLFLRIGALSTDSGRKHRLLFGGRRALGSARILMNEVRREIEFPSHPLLDTADSTPDASGRIAVAYSFFATPEHELITGSDFASRAGARQAIFVFTEVRSRRACDYLKRRALASVRSPTGRALRQCHRP